MSMVQQLIAAIGNTERQLNEEISKLTNYQAKIDKVSQQVKAVLDGSSQQYVQQMTDQLVATKQQVEETIRNLQTAKEKLAQVKLI